MGKYIGMRRHISRGDIIRTRYPDPGYPPANIYLGSGRFGAAVGPSGLMDTEYTPRSWNSIPNTLLMHADHWVRGAYGLDAAVPLGRLYLSGLPKGPPETYYQHLHLYDGFLETRLQYPGLRLVVRLYFNPELRDILAVDFSYSAASNTQIPDIFFTVIPQTRSSYQQNVITTIENPLPDEKRSLVRCRIVSASDAKNAPGRKPAESLLLLQVTSADGGADFLQEKNAIALKFTGRRGESRILLGSAGISWREELEQELKTAAGDSNYSGTAETAWNRRWGASYVNLPDDRFQALWTRSVYYLLSSFSPDLHCPVSPMGYTGNGWPYHFPQDMAYIFPVFLRLGHFDIAESIVGYYRKCLENMRDFTSRIYGREGIFWAWEFPMDEHSRLLSEGSPNWYQFELHNSAYPAFMAFETFRHTRNREWGRETAFPVILESARFYGDILVREEDGTWGIHLTPSMGQDEWGGIDGKNYLCALFSAEYCLKTALKTAEFLEEPLPEKEKWEKILSDGLAYHRLYHHEYGIYMPCQVDPSEYKLGRQKHPVQLGPAAFVPAKPAAGPEHKAFAVREHLCQGTGKGFYTGWTLATYWLTAIRLGKFEEFVGELEKAVPASYADPDWTVLYETSGDGSMPMYLTNHGLYVQAVNDTFVGSFFRDITTPSGVPQTWEGAEFHNFHLPGGKTAGGKCENGRVSICQVRYC